MDKYQQWSHYYSTKRNTQVYPTEWVVRTLAGGNYPQMQLDKSKYQGEKILDLSCGDGRNLDLLQNLGFEVYATEIADTIVAELNSKKRNANWNATFTQGTNTNLPFPNNFFKYILSCWSFYYLDTGTDFNEVLREISRVMSPGGIFIAGIPDPHNFVLKDAEILKDGSFLITNDPYKLRNGSRWMVAQDRDHCRELMSPYFRNIKIGHLNDDYWGLRVSGFVFTCQSEDI